MAASPTTRPEGSGGRAAPAAFSVLAERFDPEVIDVRTDPARVRLGVDEGGEWDAVITAGEMRLRPADPEIEPDATIRADARSWERIASDVRGGMDAFRRGKLRVRRNLHLGVGFLAATSGITDPGRLRFDAVETAAGTFSTLSAGTGPPVLCIHGLGGTKASFMPTVRGLADGYRVIAADLPGFGDSDKPITAPYDAPYFAESVLALMDALEIERAHLIGNSMGGRVSIEVGLTEPDRVDRVVLLSPALAWLRDRPWKWLLPPQLPKLGLLQPTPRAITEPLVRRLVPGGGHGWSAAGVDEFLRAFLTPRGRAAFYTALRNIYVDEPHGDDGLWTRLAELAPDSMFVWGRHDNLVPISFMKHVERTLPAARHLELDCGHVPQVERPEETNKAIREFLR
ncbi:MAG TPA: alpha/beta fold hydrolase [Solirubrobacterales bacterium]